MSSRTMSGREELEATLRVLGLASGLEHLLHRPEGRGVNARLRPLLPDEGFTTPFLLIQDRQHDTDDVDGREYGAHNEDGHERPDDGVHRPRPLVKEEISIATWRACMSPSAWRREAASGTA